MADTDNTIRRTARGPRRDLPTFLTQPATVDLLLAVLVEYARGTDRSTPVGGALGATVDGVVDQLVEGGFGTGLDPRDAVRDGIVREGRFGTDG